MRRHTPRGFTLLELMVVVAIIGIVAGLAVASLRRARPRANFESTSAEIQSLVHQARLEALGSGANVAVMIFPGYAIPGSEGVGRIIVVRESTDPLESLFSEPSGLKFSNYDPGLLRARSGGKVVTSFDFPKGIVVGPDDGMGPDALQFPYKGITTNLDCPFCSGSGATRRGAIVFDGRGRPTFYSADGVVDQPPGSSFTIMSQDLATNLVRVTSTLVITCPQGLLRTYRHG